MPVIGHNVSIGVPNTVGPHSVKGFDEVVTIYEERNFTITGVSKDSTGAALGGCLMKLVNKATDQVEQTQISDATGNYSFIVDKTMMYYIFAYKVGAPDVAGVTVNTLVGS